MTDLDMMLSQEERDFLTELLQTTLKEKRVEEHRTRAPAYRERVLREEELIVGLLSKLGQPKV